MMQTRSQLVVVSVVLGVLGLGSVGVANTDAGPGERPSANFLKMESNYPENYKSRLTAIFEDETRATVESFQYADSRNNQRAVEIDEMRRGVVLVRALNKDMVRVDAPEFDPEKGGRVFLTFYRVFMGNDRRVVAFDFSREADGTWIAFYPENSDRTLFDTLQTHIVSNGLGMPNRVDKVTLKSDDRVVKSFKTETLPRAQSLEDPVAGFFPTLNEPTLIGVEVLDATGSW